MNYTSSDDDDGELHNSVQDRLDAISRLLMSVRGTESASPPPPSEQMLNVERNVSGRLVADLPHTSSTNASTAEPTSTTAAAPTMPDDAMLPSDQLVAAATSAGAIHNAIIVEDGRYCWVCFATDEDDELAEWVQPCNCTGTIRWVHQGCLQRWVDEKQKGNSMRRVTCPQCQTEYIIVYPAMSLPVQVMERFDTMIKCLSPFLAAGILVGSLYWTAVTFGAVTVLQVVGQQDGLDMMESADPLVLLIGLPAIPVGLVLGRMVRWEDMVLRLMQNRVGMARKFPLLSLLLPMPDEASAVAASPPTAIMSDQVSGTRIFCGALLLPTFSAIMGRLFFDSVQNNVHRTLIGGLAFVALKGAIKIYFKQKQFARKKQRKILDYTAENQKRYVQPAASNAAAAAAAVGQQQREVVI